MSLWLPPQFLVQIGSSLWDESNLQSLSPPEWYMEKSQVLKIYGTLITHVERCQCDDIVAVAFHLA